MLIDEITSAIKKSLEGSIASSDSRFRASYLEDVAHQVRAECCVEIYNGSNKRAANKLIDQAWYQTLTITKDPDLQTTGAAFTYWELGTTPIVLDQNTNGLHIGNLNETSNFIQAQSKGMLNILQGKGYRASMSDYFFLIKPPTGIEIFGNKALKTIYVSVIAQNPLDLVGFSPETDQYPMPESAMGLFIEKATVRLLMEKQVNANISTNENPD